MSSPDHDTRTVLTLTTGSKISVLVAMPFIVAAAYFLFVQISIPSAEGDLFWCSSAFSPPSDKFPRSVCQDAVQVYQLRAALLFAAGLLVAGIGVLFFGIDRGVERRAGSVDDSDEAVDEA
jgi:hypothetical protein